MNKEEIKVLVSYNDLMSNFAKFAVYLSPYPRPDNLEVVLDKADSIIKEFVGETHFKEFTYREIKAFCFSGLIEKIPECVKWNDRMNGIEGNGFSSRYDSPSPNNNFIDLDAFARNIANEILFSRYNGDSIPDILNGKATKRGE